MQSPSSVPTVLAVFISVPIKYICHAVVASYLIAFGVGITSGLGIVVVRTPFVRDVMHGVYKSIIFGAVIAWCHCIKKTRRKSSDR